MCSQVDKMIPREKMSKSQRRTLDLQKRANWGGINPVTRKTPNGKAYNRKKTQKGVEDDFRCFESFSLSIILVARLPILSHENQSKLFCHPLILAA